MVCLTEDLDQYMQILDHISALLMLVWRTGFRAELSKPGVCTNLSAPWTDLIVLQSCQMSVSSFGGQERSKQLHLNRCSVAQPFGMLGNRHNHPECCWPKTKVIDMQQPGRMISDSPNGDHLFVIQLLQDWQPLNGTPKLTVNIVIWLESLQEIL